MLPSLQKAAGEENVLPTEASTWSEDFYIDEGGFKTGIKAFCQLVIDYSGSY